MTHNLDASAASPKDEAGAPEVEITPEMTKAGADALASFNRDFESAEDAADRVFRAMIENLIEKKNRPRE